MTEPVDFDEYTSNYNDLIRESTGFFSKDDEYFARYKVDLAKAIVPSQGVEAILEYGCGIGRNIPYLKSAYPDAEVQGSDISAAGLEFAKKQLPDTKFIIEETEEAKSIGSVDLIFVAGVFHHIPMAQRDRCLKLLFDRLNPGGNLIIFEHNPYNPVTQRIVSNCEFDADAVLLKPSNLRNRAIKAGFSNPKTSYCLFAPPKFKFINKLEKHLGWLPLGGQYFLHCSK